MAHKQNPFFNMGPIEDPRYFVNRGEELRRLLQYVSNHMSCSIVGSRKIGKSSLVRQAMRLAINPQNNSADMRTCLWVYLDCGQVSSVTKSGFWKELLKRFAVALGDLPAECQEGTGIDWEHLFKLGTVETYETESYLAGLQSRGIKPIIVLDEFESIVCNANLDYSFYAELRSFAPKLTYVTITQSPLHCLDCHSSSIGISPFFNIFVVLPVKLFAPTDARELLVSLSSLGGQPYSPSDIEFLMDLAGCHPFFLQQAGYQLFETYSKDRPRPAQKDAYPAVDNYLRLQARPHFEGFWTKLGPSEKSLLHRIAELGEVDRDSLSPSEKIVLFELEDKALVSTADMKNCRLFSRTFDEFVKTVSSSMQC